VYVRVKRVLNVTSTLLALASLVTLGVGQVVYGVLHQEGYTSFATSYDVYTFGNEYIASYRVLQFCAVLQLLGIVVAFRTMWRKHNNSRTTVGNSKTKTPRTKIDNISQAYTVYCISVCLLMVLWLGFPATLKAYYVILTPAIFAEGLCLAIIVFPYSAKRSSRPQISVAVTV
ncbi:hypothetical protein KIPB_007386, partial [Kipferlia bialata]